MNNIIIWSRATAQSMIDGEPDELFQPAVVEFNDALTAAIEQADGKPAVIQIEINP